MVRVNIDFPDDVGEQLGAAARAAGHPSIESYIYAVFTGGLDEDEDYGAPPGVSCENDDQLEAMLLERAKNPAPSIEVTAEYFQDLKRQVLGDDPTR
jgi:hypothetical protein